MSLAITSDGRLAVAAAWIVAWVAACTMIVSLLLAPPAAAVSRHATLVLDGNSGRVLQSTAADEPRYPASLTKMMTLYLVFELVEQGRLKPTTRIKVSDTAAAAPPSKLGLEPGDQISVSDAVKALIVKSANDVAVAVAEHIGGSEQKFAVIMTRKARELGMRSTTFRNAHGLPDPEQVTTARDMAILGLALYDHHPKHARLFALRSFAYNGSVLRNHNTMLGRFQGVEGIKTGYTRASGFNLVSSLRRDRRHIIGIVMGGRSAASRNAHMGALLQRNLHRASTTRTRKPILLARAQPEPRNKVAHQRYPAPKRAAAPAPAPTPAPRIEHASPPVHMARVRTVSIMPLAPPRPLPAAQPNEPEPPAARLVEPPSLVTPPAPGLGARPSTLAAQAARLEQNQPAVIAVSHTAALPERASADDATPAALVATAPPASIAGSHVVQIGAFATQAEAESRLAETLRTLARVIASGQPFTEPVNLPGRTLYRARFAGYDAKTAASTCLQLRRHQVDCLVARGN